MTSDPTLREFDKTAFVADVKEGLDRLLSRKFTKSGTRRGAQHLAFACVYEVAKTYELFADPEYLITYVDEKEERKGWLDVAIEEPDYHLGLLLACEIVTDKVSVKDLLKLRDAPVTERGLRLLIQLNPKEKYPITRPKALLNRLTDEEADEILIMCYQRPLRTLLERRNGSRWAIEQEQVNAENAKYVLS